MQVIAHIQSPSDLLQSQKQGGCPHLPGSWQEGAAPCPTNQGKDTASSVPTSVVQML